MRLAVSAGGGAPENLAYVQTLLGKLEIDRGNYAAARSAYREALAASPGFLAARAGLARVDAAGGRLGAAIDRYRAVVEEMPLPEYVTGLGEAELAAGRDAAAARDLGLVAVEARLLRSAGVNVDLELALYEADHGSAARAVEYGRAAWRRAPSVRSADARTSAGLEYAFTRMAGPSRSRNVGCVMGSECEPSCHS
jgi:tetratricopeptide (TPR) repeat protein